MLLSSNKSISNDYFLLLKSIVKYNKKILSYFSKNSFMSEILQEIKNELKYSGTSQIGVESSLSSSTVEEISIRTVSINDYDKWVCKSSARLCKITNDDTLRVYIIMITIIISVFIIFVWILQLLLLIFILCYYFQFLLKLHQKNIKTII